MSFKRIWRLEQRNRWIPGYLGGYFLAGWFRREATEHRVYHARFRSLKVRMVALRGVRAGGIDSRTDPQLAAIPRSGRGTDRIASKEYRANPAQMKAKLTRWARVKASPYTATANRNWPVGARYWRSPTVA